jgi:hypothetical protein
VTPRPTPFESGVRCAIRAGLPIVEDGPDILDPYERWVTARTRRGVTDECTIAARDANRPLVDEISRRAAAVLRAAAIDSATFRCRLERNGDRLHVRLSGPAIGAGTRLAIAVRVLDTVRAGPRIYGRVDISYAADGS